MPYVEILAILMLASFFVLLMAGIPVALTLATTGLLLLIALFTVRHRTLHDLASGLVVARTRALTGGFGSWNMQGGSPYA